MGWEGAGAFNKPRSAKTAVFRGFRDVMGLSERGGWWSRGLPSKVRKTLELCHFPSRRLGHSHIHAHNAGAWAWLTTRVPRSPPRSSAILSRSRPPPAVHGVPAAPGRRSRVSGEPWIGCDRAGTTGAGHDPGAFDLGRQRYTPSAGARPCRRTFAVCAGFHRFGTAQPPYLVCQAPAPPFLREPAGRPDDLDRLPSPRCPLAKESRNHPV